MFQVSNKFFALFTFFVFLALLVEHGLRLYFNWSLVYAGVEIPLWISAFVVILAVLAALAAVKQLR